MTKANQIAELGAVNTQLHQKLKAMTAKADAAQKRVTELEAENEELNRADAEIFSLCVEHYPNVSNDCPTEFEVRCAFEYFIELTAKCRAAAGWATDKDPMQQEGWAAFGDPASVPDFIKSQFDAAHKRIAELEEALADLYRDEKLDDGDPRLAKSRARAAAVLGKDKDNKD